MSDLASMLDALIAVTPTKEQARALVGYAAWMRTWEPAEYARALQGHSATDEFKIRSQEVTLRNHFGSEYRLSACPVTLDSWQKQGALIKAVKRNEELVRLIPQRAAFKNKHKGDVLALCRYRAQRHNCELVITAILHRVAMERKIEVLFSYSSIQTWIDHVSGESINVRQIGTALRFLHKHKWARVEFAERGYFGRSTKIRVNLNPKEIAPVPEADDFVDKYRQAMRAVYTREEVRGSELVEIRVACDAKHDVGYVELVRS